MTKCTGVRTKGKACVEWHCPLKLHCKLHLNEPTEQFWQIDAPFNDETYTCELYLKVENEAYNKYCKGREK